jgi:RNA polymerase sigma-70 factor, ECF subfamily
VGSKWAALAGGFRVGEAGGEGVYIPVVPAPGSRATAVTFDALYRSAYRPVLKLAYVLCGSWTIAEEVTQEAFLRALPRLERLDNPHGWVRCVAANLARSRLRRLGAEMRALGRLAARPVPPSTESELLPAELDRFWAEVRNLPPRQAQAIAYHYLEDRPVREVAELMGCSEGTAKALLHQARQRLARRLLDGEVVA